MQWISRSNSVDSSHFTLKFWLPRPYLKNLSRGSKMRRGSNMVGIPLEIVFSVSRFEPGLNWNRFLADQRHGLNSLNSASYFRTQKVYIIRKSYVVCMLKTIHFLKPKDALQIKNCAELKLSIINSSLRHSRTGFHF